MNTLIQADIFFFISSIGFIIITILALIAGIFLIKTIRDFKRFLNKIEDEAENIIEDVEDLRGEVRSKMQTISSFATVVTSTAFLHKFLKGKKKKD